LLDTEFKVIAKVNNQYYEESFICIIRKVEEKKNEKEEELTPMEYIESKEILKYLKWKIIKNKLLKY